VSTPLRHTAEAYRCGWEAWTLPPLFTPCVCPPFVHTNCICVCGSEWCGAQKEDMDKRQKMREKKEKTAVSCRLKGNNYFKARKYEKALEQYMEALNEQGYKSNILTNIIQAQVKLKNYEDALEFCDRALHVDRDNVKALSRRAHVFVEACDQSSKGKVKVARIKALQVRAR